ncbi:helix-turn-helix domain-containing protein [Pseudonocardia humida]|uniref:Helix-turn-helix domain-containing protein n=1 Tax=Pseudonocardia humida TaxID=2800819 RepID=A0ABT0ZZB4_9PSEU|nr:helix-turn-helix domain-containing protein [Pseudonocardia humida]MCO1655994.1 helix-turn-helix domain-containing protein [Pseudonocardia humida]
MSRRRADLARVRRTAGLTQEELAGRIGVDRSTVGRWEAGSVDPTLWARGELARVLRISAEVLGELLGDTAGDPTSTAPPTGPSTSAAAPTSSTTTPLTRPLPALQLDAVPLRSALEDADDEVEAIELARRVAASDVGEETLTRLERIVDDLAQAYLTDPPLQALMRTRRHLQYVTGLLDVRATFAQRRRLLAVGGWLSLLAGTLHIDLEQQGPAVARIRTARILADECGHDELAACTVETEAWRSLTIGDFPEAARLAQLAQEIAPAGSSAHIQATAQEARAQARLHDVRAAAAVVGRVTRLAEPLADPDHPEHHFRYDRVKATSYTATTLTWLGDPAAVEHAREVVRAMSTDGTIAGRVRRLALSRLDLALALVGRGEVAEAAQVATSAMRSRLLRSDLWRAREVVQAVAAVDRRSGEELREAYRQLVLPLR